MTLPMAHKIAVLPRVLCVARGACDGELFVLGGRQKMSVAVNVGSPYSSVVEHPLSKRKVGNSILPGGSHSRRSRDNSYEIVQVILLSNRRRLSLFCASSRVGDASV